MSDVCNQYRLLAYFTVPLTDGVITEQQHSSQHSGRENWRWSWAAGRHLYFTWMSPSPQLRPMFASWSMFARARFHVPSLLDRVRRVVLSKSNWVLRYANWAVGKLHNQHMECLTNVSAKPFRALFSVHAGRSALQSSNLIKVPPGCPRKRRG